MHVRGSEKEGEEAGGVASQSVQHARKGREDYMLHMSKLLRKEGNVLKQRKRFHLPGVSLSNL